MCLGLDQAVMKLDLSCSVWVLAVGLLPLVRITAGSILGAAVNIELLDQDRSQPVRPSQNDFLCSVH